jgi:hypothetical protein
MDEELRQQLLEMEARLVGQVNRSTERILDRLTALEGDVRNLRSEHSVTRDTVLKLPGIVLGAIEEPLLRRITAIETRVTKLEP